MKDFLLSCFIAGEQWLIVSSECPYANIYAIYRYMINITIIITKIITKINDTIIMTRIIMMINKNIQ